jgi:hypothetical protein
MFNLFSRKKLKMPVASVSDEIDDSAVPLRCDLTLKPFKDYLIISHEMSAQDSYQNQISFMASVSAGSTHRGGKSINNSWLKGKRLSIIIETRPMRYPQGYIGHYDNSNSIHLQLSYENAQDIARLLIDWRDARVLSLQFHLIFALVPSYKWNYLQDASSSFMVQNVSFESDYELPTNRSTIKARKISKVKKGHREVPAYLSEFLRPTPSSILMLCAAWDGLSVESQVYLLKAVGQMRIYRELRDRVFLKGLDSKNAYVRYLAAQRLSGFSPEVQLKIESDPDPLVKHSLLETDGDFLSHSGESFWALPHDARLATVRLLEGGRQMVAILEYAAEHALKEGNISERELEEVITDYAAKPQFMQYYSELPGDGYDAFCREKELKSFWAIVHKFPDNAAQIMIENLPSGNGLDSIEDALPEEVFRSFSEKQLITLLYRKDIFLFGLRRELIFNKETDSLLRYAAASNHFIPQHSELAALFSDADLKSKTVLKDLFPYGSIVQSIAILDFLGRDYFQGAESIYAKDGIKKRISDLRKTWKQCPSNSKYEEMQRELKIYQLAKKTVPWKKSKESTPLPAALGFLQPTIVTSDTWATFMAFLDALKKLGNDLDILGSH